jgi:hypothetical protein
MTTIRTLTVLALLLAAAPGQPAAAFEPVSTDGGNVAIEGYDAVAYFTEGEPVRGSPDYEHEWQGARWQFSNAEHRDLFAGAPDRYAPRYGGFCSGAMAAGRTFRADPEAWRIIDGRLYLNFSQSGIERFEKDAEEMIPKADANWEEIETIN